jgi:hypothetical protein
LDPAGTIRKQRATIEKLTRENRKMKAGGSIRGLLFDPCLSIGRNISELSTVDISIFFELVYGFINQLVTPAV